MGPEEREESVVFVRALIISSDMARHSAVVRDFAQLYPVRVRKPTQLEFPEKPPLGFILVTAVSLS